jgi:hypothetical protein
MLFPDDERQRQAYVARLWERFYPVYEEAKLGEPVGRSVLLSIMRTAAAVASIDKAEIGTRYWEGMLAGEQLKVLAAIARANQTAPPGTPRRSWSQADRKQPGCSLPGARQVFL